MSDTPAIELRKALAHLRAADPVLGQCIAAVGPFGLELQADGFKMLARSIVSQQISTAAARSIRNRLETLCKPGRLSATRVAALSRDELRSAGLSGQKAEYLHALAEAVARRRVRFDRLRRMSDEQVIEVLTTIKGIGRWTAQMFLIFGLGRPDVFPHDDLGVRSALKHLYGLTELPDRTNSLAIAERWRPHATVASWYCWRSLDLKKQLEMQKKLAEAEARQAARPKQQARSKK